MADLNYAVERMRYWCTQGNLGYDQWNRQDIRYGGECDCSSLVIHVLNEAGFDTGSASYTGNMRSNLVARGWKVCAVNGNPQKGDILLNDGSHVAMWLGDCLGQASIDENGNIKGGQSGDQTGYETNVRSYYNYPWNCYLRWGGASTSVEPTGSDMVKQAQKWLVDNGYSVGAYGIDGICGADTKAALTRALQKTMNTFGASLVVDGIYGENTGNAYDDYGPVGVDVKKQRKTLIKVTQAALMANGYSVGSCGIDGICGNDTDSAIRQFQKDHGLVVDGLAGKQTGYKLFV